MPPKKPPKFKWTKRGRGGVGRGAIGRGRGGWLGRVTELQISEEDGSGSSSQASAESDHTYANALVAAQATGVPLPSSESSNVNINDTAGQSSDTSCGESSTTHHELITISLSCNENQAGETNKTVEHSSELAKVVLPSVQQISCDPHMLNIVLKAHEKIVPNLPPNWISIYDKDSITAFLVSKDIEKTTQRRVSMSISGVVSVSVHRQVLSETKCKLLTGQHTQTLLHDSTVDEFVTNFLRVVEALWSYEVCAGCEHREYEELWNVDSNGFIDLNPYGECRYSKTYRANNCVLLVPTSAWCCKECTRVSQLLKKKYQTHSRGVKENAPNISLTENEKLLKLFQLHKDLSNKSRLIDRLREKVQSCLRSDAVNVDPALNDFLLNAMKGAKLTPIQELFVQQQFKSAKVAKSSGMRWHPTLIRFALLIKTTSSAAYAAIKDSGLINLPSERTLFDYAHVVEAQEGCNSTLLQQLSDKIHNYKHPFQDLHNLLLDEMHISSNLVYQKSSGEIVGYVNLRDAEKEKKILEDSLNPQKSEGKWVPPKAKKMLTYMVKGIASDVKQVVASFTVDTLSRDFLYVRTWEVITALEKSGIRIISIVCDGAAVNRAFINMHEPRTKTDTGIVYDTWNLATYPRRPLFFISDPPHLLKIIRNCFENSGYGPKHSRLLSVNGQTIEWRTIVNLYLNDKSQTLRHCPKLNAQNVFLNSYSRMKVSYAGNVISNTVGKYLQSLHLEDTSETVNFILKTNDFFDCLNGAHTFQNVKKANPLLKAYTSENDLRFDLLMKYLQYLKDWEKEANKVGRTKHEIEKRQLSRETRVGIEITIRGFIGAVKFLISEEKVAFINARVFCQDPIEQFFGKQRSSGNTNPNVDRFLTNQVKIGVHRELSVKRRSGNVESECTGMTVEEESLPKKKTKRVSRDESSVTACELSSDKGKI